MSALTLCRRGLPAAALLALAAVPAGAQTLESRIRAAGGGEVRMTYATRSGVCGDGRDVVALRDALFMSNTMESYGRWSGVKCQAGDARVTVHFGTNGAESVRVRIGGTWATPTGRTTDLGTVSSVMAAGYFLDLAERATGNMARDALLAAAVADSVNINDRLLKIGQNGNAVRETRRRAIHWLGMLGDASYVQPLVALAREGDGNRGLAEAATFALSRLPDDAGTPSLISLARDASSTETREQAVFWLGQSDDPKARAEVRRIAGDDRAPSGVRAKAVFSLGHGEAVTADDFAFLRQLFDKVDDEDIQNNILLSISQSEDPSSEKWLLDIARNERASTEARKKAIFWAGQGGVPTADIASFYDSARDEELKEHTIFVLSQRDDKAATDKLLSIVKGKDDGELKKKALFWLAQKHDPEITGMISDMITKP